MESLLFEAHKTKGWKWVQEEPLWVTWPLEKFGRLPWESCTSRTNDDLSHIRRRYLGAIPPIIEHAYQNCGCSS
jgi:hypothetical protein